jgi:ribosomal protein L37E
MFQSSSELKMEESNEKEVVYCRKCGEEMSKNATFCPSCGTPKDRKEITYIKSRGSGIGFGNVVAIIVGGLFILVGISVLFAGGALMGVTGVLDQGGGFIGVDNVDIETNTQMLVAKELDMMVDDFEGPPNWVWEPDIGDFVTIKIKADSDDDKNVFIGIVEEREAIEYLDTVEYDQISDFQMDDGRRSQPYIEYRYHPGDQLETAPIELDIWVSEVHGSGEQTLTWSPEAGRYWLVIMNQDGSPNVDVDVGFSVKIPILGNIGRGLFVGGLLVLGLGVAIIYFGVIKPRY